MQEGFEIFSKEKWAFSPTIISFLPVFCFASHIAVMLLSVPPLPIIPWLFGGAFTNYFGSGLSSFSSGIALINSDGTGNAMYINNTSSYPNIPVLNGTVVTTINKI
jgi:hypothetical protein